MDLTDDQLQRLYTWIDEIPLSRPKRNIARDFSDGVLMAEVIRHYFPTLVELHNYPSANSTQQKMYNWNTLNSKVLRKIGYNMPREDIEAVLQCRPGAVERVLNTVQMRLARYRARARSGTPNRGVSPSRGRSVDSRMDSVSIGAVEGRRGSSVGRGMRSGSPSPHGEGSIPRRNPSPVRARMAPAREVAWQGEGDGGDVDPYPRQPPPPRRRAGQ